MIEFMIVWALIGHTYWLSAMLDPDFMLDTWHSDLFAMVCLWFFWPFVTVLQIWDAVDKWQRGYNNG